MGIILLEAPHSCQTAESTAGLVPVEDAKVGKTEGQLLVTAFLRTVSICGVDTMASQFLTL